MRATEATNKLQAIWLDSSMSLTAHTFSMSFSQVYTSYRHKIYSYVFYRVGSNEDVAEDIVSDIFLKAYKAYDTYNPQYALSTWLYTISRNTLIDHYRKGKETVDIDSLELSDETDPLFTLIDTDISLTEMHEAIKSLPEPQQSYIKKQFIEGYSAREIAEEANQSHAAVRKQVSRGIAVLREKLLTVVAFLGVFNTHV